jgi:hypothetical protein
MSISVGTNTNYGLQANSDSGSTRTLNTASVERLNQTTQALSAKLFYFVKFFNVLLSCCIIHLGNHRIFWIICYPLNPVWLLVSHND